MRARPCIRLVYDLPDQSILRLYGDKLGTKNFCLEIISYI